MAVILCVEDDAVFSEIVCKALMKEGFKVIRADNGDEGLRKAEEEIPDAILLDIGLPKKDGFEVLEALKTSEQTRTIPVIMLSRLSSKEDVQQCFELGCEEYLIKTHHSPEDIVQHVRSVLRLAPAFTAQEALVVVCALLLLFGFAWWQLGHPKPFQPITGNVPLEQAQE